MASLQKLHHHQPMIFQPKIVNRREICFQKVQYSHLILIKLHGRATRLFCWMETKYQSRIVLEWGKLRTYGFHAVQTHNAGTNTQSPQSVTYLDKWTMLWKKFQSEHWQVVQLTRLAMVITGQLRAWENTDQQHRRGNACGTSHRWGGKTLLCHPPRPPLPAALRPVLTGRLTVWKSKHSSKDKRAPQENNAISRVYFTGWGHRLVTE